MLHPDSFFSYPAIYFGSRSTIDLDAIEWNFSENWHLNWSASTAPKISQHVGLLFDWSQTSENFDEDS